MPLYELLFAINYDKSLIIIMIDDYDEHTTTLFIIKKYLFLYLIHMIFFLIYRILITNSKNQSKRALNIPVGKIFKLIF